MTGLTMSDLIVVTRGTTWKPLKVAMAQYGVVAYIGHQKRRIIPIDKLDIVEQMVQNTTSHYAHKPTWDSDIAKEMIEKCRRVEYELQQSDTDR